MASGTTTDHSVPAPWSWQPSSFWDGNDGSWNTFIVGVGTPPQSFRFLPSTAGQETWILNPQGCTPDDPSDCAYTRGVLPFRGSNSSGFQANESSSWVDIGLYTIDAQEEIMGYTGNGLYGFDTVALSGGNASLAADHQVVASIADKSYYLGQFGIGPKSVNFSTFNDPIPNIMSTLVNTSKIPSLSFGYTAGAAYRDQAPASLTLGGYDANRFTEPGLSFTMNGDNSRPLQAGVVKILGENTLSGSVNLLPTATYHFIDSTIPHIWLPGDAIDAFVDAFGLQYDNTTDLFLINDTMRTRLLQQKPTITFVLGSNPQAGMSATQNIELPYDAFDLEASYPFYENATRYFPIRRAANDSQYTIGRTFFQEAFVIADWERSNFTVAQARFDSLDKQALTPILSLADEAARNQNSTTAADSQPDSGLSAGAIAGITLGSVALVALLALAYLIARRRKRRTQQKQSQPFSEYTTPDEKAPYHSTLAEASADRAINELPSHGKPPGLAEIDGSSPLRQELGYGDGFMAEVPGSEGRRYELPGHTVEN